MTTKREQMVNAINILESVKVGKPSSAQLRSQNTLMSRVQRQQLKGYNKKVEAEKKRIERELCLLDTQENGDLLENTSPFEFHIPTLKRTRWF